MKEGDCCPIPLTSLLLNAPALPGTNEQDLEEDRVSWALCDQERREMLGPRHQPSLIGPRPAENQEKAATPLRCFHGNNKQAALLFRRSSWRRGQNGVGDGRGDEGVGMG